MLRLPVALIVSMALFAQTDPNSQPPGQIAGHVQNAVTGDPIAGAVVQLFMFGPMIRWPSGQPHNVSSQPDGSFVFDNVPPGNYSVMATAPAYSPGRYKTNDARTFMDTPALGMAMFTVQPGGQVGGLVLTLQPYPNIAGKVVDDAGQPVAHAQVRALSSIPMRGKTELQSRMEATTDDTGAFQLKGVSFGRAYLIASPAPEATASNAPPATPGTSQSKLRLVSTFYPDSPDFAGAVALEEQSGQDQGDIVIHMKRAATHHIRGKAKVNVPAGTHVEIDVYERAGTAVYSPGIEATVAADSTFDIPDLLPGSYTLRLMSSVSTKQAPAASKQAPAASQHVLSRQDVTVGATDVNDIVLSETPRASVTWHVRSDDDASANLDKVTVNLLTWDDPPSNSLSFIAANPDGSHTINVDPGSYLIRVNGLPPGDYISSLQLNQTDALNKAVDLSQGGASQLEVVLRKGLAELDGSVMSSDDSVPRPAMVILVPQSLSPDGQNILRRSTGPNATFSFRDVPPGQYTAFAVEQYNYNAWLDPNFIASLQGRGVSVDLAENDRKRIEISAISGSDLQQIMAQLGLGE